MGKIRGTHSSPGIYSEIQDLNYAVNSLGITTAGLVGETLKGPAFEPIFITNKTEFKEYFGETSAEKYRDSQYPRYELPYIANSYLDVSDQLYVCRVLGLSGYNAGPAFVLTASNSKKNDLPKAIGILRSRGKFIKNANMGSPCEPNIKYDAVDFLCDKIELKPYTSISTIINGCEDVVPTAATPSAITTNAFDYGHFNIVAYKGIDEEGEPIEIGTYPVSLNAGSPDYIYKVLGSKANEGSAPIFVEDLYDVYLDNLILSNKVDIIDEEVTTFEEVRYISVAEPVRDILNIPSNKLDRKNVGQTFVYSGIPDDLSGEAFVFAETDEKGVIVTDNISGETVVVTSAMTIGQVYKVVLHKSDAGKQYFYVEVKDGYASGVETGKTDAFKTINAVKVLAYDAFAYVSNGELVFGADLSDYHDQFRCATTPWIVSELKGNDPTSLEVKKLFRFHTITDGEFANTQVKISISNIRPDNGTFDVTIRDFNDNDANVAVLESYRNLTMVPGDPHYIGYQIGTLDGAYETVSKYVLVEIIENDMTAQCVPAGFLGYPVRLMNGVEAPTLQYNRFYDEDIKDKRQYFGISDIRGIDVDMFTYKGKNAYTENYNGDEYTHAFHLDSTLDAELLTTLGASGATVSVDGMKGVIFETVDINNLGDGGVRPIIGSEIDMEGSIYEKVGLRKFTVCPYGGFDGWDIYRNSRSTGDEYKANKYKGAIKNGTGASFSKIQNGAELSLTGNCITSDYYAWLAGANQFEISERYPINIFATPGIDYVKDNLLSKEILDMIESKRKDSIYIMTTPDKPFGASDDIAEMYSSADASANLENSDIDTFYAATYYPWVKFEDKDNNIYINLPATKDVIRNLADVDNRRFPWYAPAGIERGNVVCKKMHFYAKLEDEDTLYDGRINPLKTFSEDGVKVWGQKTLYTEDTPMNRINTVRLTLYLRKLIHKSSLKLIFDPNDTTLVKQFEDILNPLLTDIKKKRGITDFRLKVKQTAEQRDAHEMSCILHVKPTPTLEYIEIKFVVTPEGVEFED